MRKMLAVQVLGLVLCSVHCAATESCKNIKKDYGEALSFRMCVVDSGPRVGDLLVKVDNDDAAAKQVNVSDCKSIFPDAPAWARLEHSSRSLTFLFEAGDRRTQWYIITTGLTQAQRASWSTFSVDYCQYNVERGAAPVAPQPDTRCPAFKWRDPDGVCRSLLE